MAKTGPDLFRELLRLYPVAEVEDYVKNGAWKDGLMKSDLQLIEAHRKEAGAPEPQSLEEVVMPENMPKATKPGLGLRPVAFGATYGAGIPATGTPAAGSAVAELRLVALFVAKWKLDPIRSKAMLAKLLPYRRRFVIQHFKPAGDGDVTDELEAYIEECETSNTWGEAPPAASPNRPLGLSLAKLQTPVRPVSLGVSTLSGVKRHFTAIAAPLSVSRLRPTTPLSSFQPVKRNVASFAPTSSTSAYAYDPNKRLRPAAWPAPAYNSTVRPASTILASRSSQVSSVSALASRLAGSLAARSASASATFRPLSAYPARPAANFGLGARPGVRPLTTLPSRLAAAPTRMFTPLSARAPSSFAAPIRPVTPYRPASLVTAYRPLQRLPGR